MLRLLLLAMLGWPTVLRWVETAGGVGRAAHREELSKHTVYSWKGLSGYVLCRHDFESRSQHGAIYAWRHGYFETHSKRHRITFFRMGQGRTTDKGTSRTWDLVAENEDVSSQCARFRIGFHIGPSIKGTQVEQWIP